MPKGGYELFLKTKYDCCGGFATVIIPWNARDINQRGNW
jgi:hypothetical protein